MTKSHQYRTHRICDSLSVFQSDEPLHKTQKYHDLKRRPLCQYQHKRSTHFNQHLKKSRGLKASAEARWIKKKTAVMAAKLKNLATSDAPASSSAKSCRTTNTNTNIPLSLADSVQMPSISDSDTMICIPEIYTQSASPSALPLKWNQRAHSSPPALSCSVQLPPTSTSSTSTYPTSDTETLSRSPTTDLYPTQTATPTTLQHEPIPEPLFLRHDLNLDWDPDSSYSQRNKGDTRALFESNQRLYDVSLAYLLSFDPLSC